MILMTSSQMENTFMIDLYMVLLLVLYMKIYCAFKV